MLEIAICDWALQTTQLYWEDFTLLMYKTEKYRRDTAETTGSAGFSANFHGITSDDVSQPPSLATASTSEISALESAFSSSAYAQTAQITALMEAMMDQQLPSNNNNARHNNARKEGNQRGKKNIMKKSYCWTHGVTTNMEHDSGTCDNQHREHQETATFDNRMGGSESICGSGQNPCRPGPAN